LASVRAIEHDLRSEKSDADTLIDPPVGWKGSRHPLAGPPVQVLSSQSVSSASCLRNSTEDWQWHRIPHPERTTNGEEHF
jgi:hypothetical protein